MAKRYRTFKRINITAKTATLIREKLVDKTFNDHYKKCVNESFDPDCSHVESGSLFVARLVEAGIKIGKKRATLDLMCPYSTNDPEGHVQTLLCFSWRLREFSKKMKQQTRAACFRVAEVVENYAKRNAMQVLAETVVDVDRDVNPLAKPLARFLS